MSNKDAVLKGLQAIVTDLSSQAHGHLIQSKIFESQGFGKLARKYADHTVEEQGYVEQCIVRILDLDGTLFNDATKENPVITDPIEWIKYDLEVSKTGLVALAKLVEMSRDDYATYDLLEKYYIDEEQDMLWSEQQLELIDKIGEQNWLIAQM